MGETFALSASCTAVTCTCDASLLESDSCTKISFISKQCHYGKVWEKEKAQTHSDCVYAPDSSGASPHNLLLKTYSMQSSSALFKHKGNVLDTLAKNGDGKDS